MKIGDRVVIRDNHGHLHRGIVVPIPEALRDTSGSDTETSRGGIWKTWVRLADNPLSTGAPRLRVDVAANRLELASLKRRAR